MATAGTKKVSSGVGLSAGMIQALQPSEEEKNNAMSTIGLRRLIGYLGILLPLSCLVYTLGFQISWLPSISHYYYTPIHGMFVAILCGLGFVLYVYRGYDKWDERATNVAALAAFGVALFPTARGPIWSVNVDGRHPLSLPPLRELFIDSEVANGYVHDISATVLFLMFFFISGFLFTRRPKVDGRPPDREELREEVKDSWLFLRSPKDAPDDARERENNVHRRCAWLILISIIMAALSGFLPGPVPWLAVFETTAILGFAISWLTKNKRESNPAKVVVNDVKTLVAPRK